MLVRVRWTNNPGLAFSTFPFKTIHEIARRKVSFLLVISPLLKSEDSLWEALLPTGMVWV